MDFNIRVSLPACKPFLHFLGVVEQKRTGPPCFDRGSFLASRPYVKRVNLGGNFCGHSPENPLLTLRVPAKVGTGGIPRVITLLMERMIKFYSKPRKTIPSLDLANGSSRQMRSERREACLCLLASLLKSMDLTSLRVGVPGKEGFRSLTLDFLAKQTNMSMRRCERALKDLKKSGIVSVNQPRQKISRDKWIGLAAVKAISKQLFASFGLAEMLRLEREKSSKRLKQKSQQWQKEIDSDPGTRTGKARLALFLGGMAQPDKKPKSLAPPGLAPRGQLETRRKQEIMTVAVEIHRKHPDWTSKQCHEEAERILSGKLLGNK